MLGAREYQLSERPSCSARWSCESAARAAVLFWPLTVRGKLGARGRGISAVRTAVLFCPLFFCESTARAAVLFWPLTGGGELDGSQLYFSFFVLHR